MKKEMISGRVYVLGDDIDTDQIIPANYLVYDLDDPNERKQYGRYALSGVPQEEAGLPKGKIPFVLPGENCSHYAIVIGGKNFGCGSSREHAPIALSMAGVRVVIAQSYARIFYRNVVDGGYFIPYESREALHQIVGTGDTIEIYIQKQPVIRLQSGDEYGLNPLGPVADIISCKGLFGYAKKQGLIR